MVNESLELQTLLLAGMGTAAAVAALRKLKARAELSLAKHRSLAGHPRNARLLASLLPNYSYGEHQVFAVDGAPVDIMVQRKAAFAALVQGIAQRYMCCGARIGETRCA